MNGNDTESDPNQELARAENELSSALSNLPDELRREYETLDADQQAAKRARELSGTSAAFQQFLDRMKAISMRRGQIEQSEIFAPVLATREHVETARANAHRRRADTAYAERMAKSRDIEARLRSLKPDDAFLAEAIPLIPRFLSAFEVALSKLAEQDGAIRNPGGWLRMRLRAEGVRV